jgi:hypothetical protein
MLKTKTSLATVTVQLTLYRQDREINDKIMYWIAEITKRVSKWKQKLLCKRLLCRNTTVPKCVSLLVRYVMSVSVKTRSAAGLSNTDVELIGFVTTAGTGLSSSSER